VGHLKQDFDTSAYLSGIYLYVTNGPFISYSFFIQLRHSVTWLMVSISYGFRLKLSASASMVACWAFWLLGWAGYTHYRSASEVPPAPGFFHNDPRLLVVNRRLVGRCSLRLRGLSVSRVMELSPVGCRRLIWRRVPWFILFLREWRDPSRDSFLSRMHFIQWDCLFL
jgi:hypothetical protein